MDSAGCDAGLDLARFVGPRGDAVIRLSPPTNRTFILALAALVGGIFLWVGLPDAPRELAFWLTAAGGLLLTLGSIFNRI